MPNPAEFIRPYIDHQIAELIGVNQDLLDDVERVRQASIEVVKELGLMIVREPELFKFRPIGITLSILLMQSHYLVHTWPERGYMNVNVMSCSEAVDLSLLPEVLAQKFNPTQVILTPVLYPNLANIRVA